MTTTHRVILDTDIGSDVDDALALGVLLGSDEVDLAALTTVYGDTQLRAQLAKRLCRLAGRDDIPVVPGTQHTLSGRAVWWAGHEGSTFADLATEDIAEDRTAVETLTGEVASAPGAVDILAIGPLTNIAEAIRADPSFVSGVRHLYVMGGHFGDPDGQRPAEHNFACDACATAVVFDSGIPVTVTGLEITRQTRIGAAEVSRIASAGEFGRALESEIRRWWDFLAEQSNIPHDPLSALTMLRPDLFEASPGTVQVAVDGAADGVGSLDSANNRAGAVRLVPAPDGATRVVTGVRAVAAVEDMVDRMVTAGTR